MTNGLEEQESTPMEMRKMMVRIEDAQVKRLKSVAVEHDTTYGIVARALIRQGLDAVDTEATKSLIDKEVDAVREERREIGRKSQQH